MTTLPEHSSAGILGRHSLSINLHGWINLHHQCDHVIHAQAGCQHDGPVVTVRKPIHNRSPLGQCPCAGQCWRRSTPRRCKPISISARRRSSSNMSLNTCRDVLTVEPARPSISALDWPSVLVALHHQHGF